MKNLAIFNFNANKVRIDTKQKQIMFCLVDICNILGIKDRSQIRQRLNPRGMYLIPTPTNSGVQKTYYVNEPNLYRVILRSDKPIAREFENWVCEEVLPSIRKTGVYSAVDKPVVVQEHTRALPTGKKEIVLSEKAKTEIGGIVKSCLGGFQARIDEKELAHRIVVLVTAFNFKAQHDTLIREANELRYQAEQREKQARELERVAEEIENIERKAC